MRRDLISLFLVVSLSCLALSNALNTTPSFLVSRSYKSLDSHNRSLEDDATAQATESTTAETTTPEEDTTIHAEPEEHEESKFTPDQTEFWLCLAAAIFLVCFAGAMSGLTVGYLSIDELQLEMKMKNGTDQEKADAMIIMPILAKHHLLLSTLLLANSFAMEALPIFLDSIMSAYVAVIISTSAVVVFGEIIPQAYCTGPDQIKIARRMAPLVKFLILVLYPICYPISLALDHFLGIHQKTRFVKRDLKALIGLHGAEGSHGHGHGTGHGHGDGHVKTDAELTVDEIKVINSMIDLRDTPVTKEMEKIEKVYMISSGSVIDASVFKRIVKSGFSKIPVYKNRDKNNVIGFIKVKNLLDFEKYEGKTVEESGLALNPPLIVAKDTSMLEMLMLFQEKKTGIALVSEETVKDKGGNALFYSRRNLTVEETRTRLVGLISLKDIFEEILEAKMADYDVHGPVTLHSGPAGGAKKRFGGKSPLAEISEASERPEKGLTKPLLQY